MPAHNQAVLTSSKCALFVIYVAGVSIRRVILKGFGREGRTVSSNSPSTPIHYGHEGPDPTSGTRAFGTLDLIERGM